MSEDKSSLDSENSDFGEETKFDPSKRAEAVLDRILQTDVDVGDNVESPVLEEEQVPVSEAVHGEKIINQDTGRKRARVLFVTTNEDVLVPNSSIRNLYLKLAEQFSEVHVLCLISRQGQDSMNRASDNVWFYQVRAKNWWSLPWKAKSAAIEALTWGGVPRPDVVVGIDPFEAGLAAKIISEKFKRPWQLHLHTNPFEPNFITQSNDSNWRLRIAKYLLKRVKSVRTNTSLLKELISKKYKKILDIAVLPRFYNFTGLLNAVPTFDLHERYPDFAFTMVAFGPLTADSHLHSLFSTLNRLLHNMRIGLVVVGDGPAKELFTEKIKLLGIEKSVVFLKEEEDLPSLLKTADLLVEMSTGEDGEVRVLQAAAAGLPAVALATDLRRDLFKDGESAFLCEPEDTFCVSQKVSKFINVTALRSQLSDNALMVAKDRLHEDPNAHYRALAATIESVLFE